MLLKGKVHSKIKASHCLLALMWMEGQLNYFIPPNTAGVSQEKGRCSDFLPIVVNGKQSFKHKKMHHKTIKCLHTAHVKKSKCCKVSKCQAVLTNVTDSVSFSLTVHCRRSRLTWYTQTTQTCV